MTDPQQSRHVEVRNDEDRTAAVADVTTAAGPDGTVRASVYAKNENVRPGDRAAVVDAVMELPEVKASDRLEATVAYGDSESVERLRERTQDPVVRAAGATTLLDADIPPVPERREADADIPPVPEQREAGSRADEQPPADS